MNRTYSSAVIAAALLGPGVAHAGGFTVARFGGEHGHAASDSVTSIYYNPAGLALGDGTRIYVEGTFAYRTVDYTRDEGAIDNPGTGTPDDAIAANAGEAHLANAIASPFFGVASDLGGKGVTVALGFYAPFGGQAAWDQNEAYAGNEDYPGAVDGVQRWANIEGLQRSLYFTLGAAWASPNKTVSFGIGLNAIKTEISLVRARQATGTDDVVGEGRSLIEVDDLTFGLGLGATWMPNKQVRVGVSYQSKPGFGEMSLEGTLENTFPSGQTQQDVILYQRMPDVARVAAEVFPSPQLTLRFAADWQHWKAYENQCLVDAADDAAKCAFNADGSLDVAGGGSGVVVNLPRDWKDTFGVKAGAGYAIDSTLEVAGSLSYDSNAVPDDTMDPGLFDMNKVILQLGAAKALGKLELTATLGQVFYAARTTEPRAVDPTPPSLNPDMAGEYKSSVTYGMIGVGAKL